MSEMFVIKGIPEVDEKLRELVTTHIRMQKELRTLFREAMKVAKKEVQNAAKSELGNDPRQAYRAVRSTIWRKALGGSVNILSNRKASGKMSTYEPPKKLQPGQRGGNRMPRSRRTQMLMSYYGPDRDFVLRFLNAGAGLKDPRITRSGANRGSIFPRNWFAQPSERGLNEAADIFSNLVDRAIMEIWNNETTSK